MIHRFVGRLAIAATLAGSLAACATYRDDLDRAMGHYEGKRYDHALALLVVLESDIDSLSKAERAQYDYHRGMSHYLLEQKREARHWLALAIARNTTLTEDEEKPRAAAALRPDEKKKATEILEELNAERMGGAESTGPDDGESCETDEDCGAGRFCDAGACASAPEEADDEARGPGEPPAGAGETDQPGTPSPKAPADGGPAQPAPKPAHPKTPGGI